MAKQDTLLGDSSNLEIETNDSDINNSLDTDNENDINEEIISNEVNNENIDINDNDNDNEKINCVDNNIDNVEIEQVEHKQESLKSIFNSYINTKSIFKDKNKLTIKYEPNNIAHRDELITQLGGILAPALRGERPSNVFIYGKTGTGKTLVTSHVLNQMKEVASLNDVFINTYYVNCKMKKASDTEYRLLASLANMMMEEDSEFDFKKKVPATGLPTDEVYKIFIDVMSKKKGSIILVLDEIDALIEKVGDEILYNFTRINQDEGVQLTIIGISNNMSFINEIDARVKSSLSDEEILFPPYNAMQLLDILKRRSEEAFVDSVVGEGVLNQCAASAAREHGDARRALDLLRVAGELTERDKKTVIISDFVNMAEAKMEKDHIFESLKAQPKHSKIVLLSMIYLSDKGESRLHTGDVIDKYISLCALAFVKPLTNRSVGSLITELDMMGLINTRVVSRGRHGRTRTITLSLNNEIKSKAKDFLESELRIKD